jgi:hypothetical protein
MLHTFVTLVDDKPDVPIRAVSLGATARKAPTARSLPAWDEAPGTEVQTKRELKARPIPGHERNLNRHPLETAEDE